MTIIFLWWQWEENSRTFRDIFLNMRNFPRPSSIFKDIKKIQEYSRNFKDRDHYVYSPLMCFKESPGIPGNVKTYNSEVSEQTYWQAWRRLENVITESTEFTC